MSMIKGKEIYGLILKHYNLFKPYIQKMGSRYDNIQMSNNEKNVIKNDIPILRLEYNGIGIVTFSYQEAKSKGFVMFSVYEYSILYEMQKYIKLYKRDRSLNFMCHFSNLDILFKNFSDYIYNIDAPYATIKSEFFEDYLKINNNFLTHNIFSSDWFYKQLKKYGIWGFDGLYTSVIWTFSIVEKYKEFIDWKKLIELSNLEWNEDKLNEFYDYVPFSTINEKNYISRYNYAVRDFSKFIIEDKKFILDNFYKIDIENFLETACYPLDKGDITLYYNMLSGVQGTYMDSSRIPERHCQLASEYLKCGYFSSLRNNKNIKWTPELLLELGNNCCEFLRGSVSNHNDYVSLFEETFLLYPELSKLLNGPIFIARLKEGKQEYDSYSINFTPENIRKNIKAWNEVLTDKFMYTHRYSSDTSFYVYYVKTKWNYFNENHQLYLTYDLCKLLEELIITIGGEYLKEYSNQTVIDEGFYTKEINALEYFSAHNFFSETEMQNVCEDLYLLEKLIGYGNEYIIKYIVENFFKDYSIKSFLEVVNQIGLS